MKKLKQTLSLSLALVLSLALAVPAFAAGTTETVVDEEHGVTITMNGFLRKETHAYLVEDGPDPDDYVPETLTLYVLADGSKVEVKASDGFKYGEYDDGLDKASLVSGGYAWKQVAYLVNGGDFLRVNGGSEPEPLEGPDTYTVEDFGINITYSVYWVSESDFAKLVPVDEQPTQPSTDITVDPIPASGTAVASTQTVTVDGKAVEFQMYALLDANGNGTNYIKLRDMAHVLNGTKAQFSVGYSNETGISATSGQPYQDTGSEMNTPFSGDRAYTGGGQSVQINGKAVTMTAISLLDDNGGGYTYFKLRDLGAALGFNVGWSADRGVYVETDKPYIG